MLDQRFVHDIAEVCPRHLDVKVHVHRHGFLQWRWNGENPRAESSVTSVDHCHLRDIAALKVQSRRTICKLRSASIGESHPATDKFTPFRPSTSRSLNVRSSKPTGYTPTQNVRLTNVALGADLKDESATSRTSLRVSAHGSHSVICSLTPTKVAGSLRRPAIG
jgi:hypothetical protein